MTWQRFYVGLATLLIGLWLLAALGGWEAQPTESQQLPSSVRSSPGGYRSFHFWYLGTHGGK